MASEGKTEQTYIMIKPDGTQRGLVGKIIERFERRGYKLTAMKLVVPPRDLVEKHYADLSSKGFFSGLVDYITSGAVVCMVWEGLGAVSGGRALLGATNPKDSLPGTIRGDFCLDIGRNICHGSDTVENAQKEIALWFPEGVQSWTSCAEAWVYE
eukprot:CAMPEP_0203811332 /NCGR_PEP_ID=MMETSP0115-20131106/3491_1 /ASSEMBLY_ACC=CAM_ASM_000227 /TAXON_ID=33651 /ORGANISM="Bicosoecid sp, Strain ms1" /LENGTH=154 /DNA_ID=CAMNT_0050720155 /DNA_START=46 /DNA_END=510 /DNA_ORIENTATION=-